MKRTAFFLALAILIVSFAGCEAKHEYRAGEVVSPTCTDRGYTVYTCDCGKTYNSDYVDPLGHDFDFMRTDSERTDSDTLYMYRECKNCGEREYTEYDIRNYDFDAVDYTELDALLEGAPEHTSVAYTPESAERLDEAEKNARELRGKLTTEQVMEQINIVRGAIMSLSPLEYDIDRVMIETGISSVEFGIKKDGYIGAKITVISSGGDSEIVYDDAAKVKIRGNTTSNMAKKPYNIKFSKKTEVLGMAKAKKWALLANATDKTLLRNALAFDFASELDLSYTSEYRFVEVWINGVNRGSYLLVESVEVGDGRVDIDPEDGDVLLETELDRVEEDVTYIYSPIYRVRFAFNEPEKPSEDVMASVTERLKNVDRAIYSSDINEIRKYIDVDSFVDYFIIGELFKNVDFSFSSTRYYFKDGILFAGPIWDYDLTCGNTASWIYQKYHNIDGYGDGSGLSYRGSYILDRNRWYRALMYNKDFASLVSQRYLELSDLIENLYSDNARGKNRIDSMIELYGASFERNYSDAGWKIRLDYGLGRYPDATYEQNVEFLRNWLKKRHEWMLATYCK